MWGLGERRSSVQQGRLGMYGAQRSSIELRLRARFRMAADDIELHWGIRGLFQAGEVANRENSSRLLAATIEPGSAGDNRLASC